VKQSAGPDHFGLLHESDAAIAHSAVKVVDVVKTAIGEQLVDKRPKVFGGLQFGTVRGLEDEADAVRYGHVFRAVPARLIHLQHDALRGPAPTKLAKSARMSSNISLQTASATFHTVRPLAGSTKP